MAKVIFALQLAIACFIAGGVTGSALGWELHSKLAPTLEAVDRVQSVKSFFK